MGKGVSKAVENINQHLGPALKVLVGSTCVNRVATLHCFYNQLLNALNASGNNACEVFKPIQLAHKAHMALLCGHSVRYCPPRLASYSRASRLVWPHLSVCCSVHGCTDRAFWVTQGLDPTKQKEVDDKMIELDGTENKGKYGANAILAISLAVAKVCTPCRGFQTCAL